MTGTVFWEGENQWGEGTRLGIEGDDGETYWINSENVEILDAEQDEGPPAPPSLKRGDRVVWGSEDLPRSGEVFWVGESRTGGQRVGIRDASDPEGEAIWRNASQVRVFEVPASSGPDDDIPY